MFALNPDDMPARLVRFVQPGTLPGDALLSIYDKTKNLLVVDKEQYDRLTRTDQHLVLRTHEPSLLLEDVQHKLPAVVPGRPTVTAA